MARKNVTLKVDASLFYGKSVKEIGKIVGVKMEKITDG